MASSIDFFYPIVDDPYKQGQLTVANVLSDIYAVGITNIDHYLAILGLSDTMNDQQRKFAATQILQGMENKTNEADTQITGGQTVFNPWVITGGSVVGIQKTDLILGNKSSQEGDVIILTKPIGTQQITDLYRALQDSKNREQVLKDNNMVYEDFIQVYDQCVNSMIQLNLYAAKTMQKYFKYVRASTDVTGFGLAGHSDNLVEIQKNNVNFVIENIPVFKYVNDAKINKKNYKLKKAMDPETSGGLLVVMDRKIQNDFQSYLFENYGVSSWYVGKVEKGLRKTVLSNDIQIEEV